MAIKLNMNIADINKDGINNKRLRTKKMKMTINEWDFRNAFQKSDTYKNNFTYDGLNALYDYLIEYEESTGEEMELDIVALCCDYTEWKNLEEFQDQHDDSYDSIETIEDHTTVIRIPNSNGFITAAF